MFFDWSHSPIALSASFTTQTRYTMFPSHKEMAKAIKRESKKCDTKCTGGPQCRIEKLVPTEFSLREAQRNYNNDVNERKNAFREKKK